MGLEYGIFLDINNHLLEDTTPSEYISRQDKAGVYLKYPFTMISDMKNANQSPVHHPEGNVWNHTMMVIDQAAKVKEKSTDKRVFMWAALLHDIGKPATTKVRKGKITSYDHEKLGAQMAEEFFRKFVNDDEFIKKVCSLIRWHMQILFVVKDMCFADIESMRRQTDINDIALLGLCDRLGRKGADRQKEEENIRIFIEKCSLVKA